MSGNPAFYKKMVSVTPPAAINSTDSSSFTTAYVDSCDSTLGKANWVNFYVYLGATDATTALAISVEECDTSGGTYAAISGTSLAPAGTNDNTIWCVSVRMGANRKRYLDVVVTNGDVTTGTFMAAWAELCYTGIQATSATGLGLGGLASV